MEFMKELSLNLSIANQVFMLLYMSGPAPTNAAELNAAVDTHDFTDMWNKSVGCSYVNGIKSAYAGVGSEWTTFFSPRPKCGQLKGGTFRPDAIPVPSTSGFPATPDYIEYQNADGSKIPATGWLGLSVAQFLCRCPYTAAPSYLSPHLVSELNPVAHIVVGFKSVRAFIGISVAHDTYSSTKSFALDYWNGSAWVQCIATRNTANVTLPFSATTDKFRLRYMQGALPIGAEASQSFVLWEAEAPEQVPVPDITWALLIPTCSRPGSDAPQIQNLVNSGEITRQTKIPFYSMSVGGPGGSEEILLTKNTALTSADYPAATGFYIKSGNFVEA